MTPLDHGVAASLIPLAVWIAISGLDDLFVIVAWLVQHLRRPAWPGERELAATPRRRIAIFVPLWREAGVIGDMLRHNVGAIRYDDYDFFVGTYPNDPETIAVIEDVQLRFSHVHLAVCPHPGPTTKADCLNWIYQHMLLYEEQHGAHFDIVVTHDAEDLIHPDSLRWINYFSGDYQMVQVPVLPLPTPVWRLTHGIYCDEFAECHTKDVAVRSLLGGFVPSCGVGTGFSREAIEKLACERANRIFEPGCLTEDYENGLHLALLGGRQLFIPVLNWKSGFLATREFFPQSFRSAVRQRTRWTIGIAMQSWERHGWSGGLGCKYWLWRDRKPLVGNFVSPLANLAFLYGLVAWLDRGVVLVRGVAAEFAALTLGIAAVQLAARAWCSRRVYGWRFAAAAPLRALWGNAINVCATVAACRRYLLARFAGRPLVWLKTEHLYPGREGLAPHTRRLGEILVDAAAISSDDLESAAPDRPPGMRLGEYLMRRGMVTEREVYAALSLQQNLDFGISGPVMPHAVRTLPVSFIRQWQVLPFRIENGALHVAATDSPTRVMRAELERLCSLEIRFRLIPPRVFDALASEHLPPV